MWSRKDCARILALAAVVLAIGLLLFPPVAHPATRPPCGARCLGRWLHADVVVCRLRRGVLLCTAGWLDRHDGRCAHVFEDVAGRIALVPFRPCQLPPMPPRSGGRGLRQ